MKIFARFAALVAFLVAFAGNLSAQTLKPVPNLVRQHIEKGVRFKSYQPFAKAGILDDKAARFARNAQFLMLDAAVLQKIVAEHPQALSLSLPYGNETVTLDLVRVQVHTPDFMVETSASGGQPVAYEQGWHYRGILRGDYQSVAAVSFFKEEVMGLLSDNRHGNRVLGKLDLPGNANKYIFYDDHNLAEPHGFVCNTPDDGKPDGIDHTQGSPEVNGCVRIFFEVDNELFVNKGSLVNTLNYVSGAFNQMATLFNNETISTQLSQVFVWVTADFYNTSSSSTVLNQFKNFRTSFNADLAHHVGIGGANYGGVAYVDALCAAGFNYAVSDINTSFNNVPTYSWTVMVLTHETGHNMGSNHTHWCGWTGGALDNCATPEGSCSPGPPPTNGGTIMSYCHTTSSGINFNNGFGTQPGNKIRTEVSTAPCLTATCVPPPSCAAPNSITVANITNNSAQISWTATTGATSYQLRYRAVGAANWTTLTSATSPTTINGLPANDEIEVTVQSTCSGGVQSGYRNGIIFKTATGGSSCGAVTNLTATPTSSTTATASWTAVTGATSYSVWRKLSTATSWGNATATTTTSVNFTGLNPSTTYDVRVQTVCGSTTSAFVTTSFTTPSSGGGGTCNAPTGLTASATGSTTGSASWNAVTGATSYSVWRKVSTTTNWGAATTIFGTSTTFSGLTASTTYDVRVQSNCSASTSAFVTTSFTTQSGGGGGGGTTCNAPTGITVTPGSSTEASVSWTHATNAITYTLQYKLLNGSAITVTGLTTPPHTLENLFPGQTYQVRMLTVCASGSSAYSAWVNFVMPTLTPGDDASPNVSGERTNEANENLAQSTLAEPQIMLAPNPANARVNVIMKYAETENVRVELLDLNGKVIEQQRVTLAEGMVTFDVAQLPQGVYLVRATAGRGNPTTLRLTKG